MEEKREKIQFHNIHHLIPALLLFILLAGLFILPCRVNAATPSLRVRQGYGGQPLSDYHLCKEFTADDFARDRIFSGSQRRIFFTGDHFVLAFAHGITIDSILEACHIQPDSLEAAYFGDTICFTKNELYCEGGKQRYTFEDASHYVSRRADGTLEAGECSFSFWQEDLLALFADCIDYEIGDLMDEYYDSGMIGRKWGEFYNKTKDQSQLEESLRKGLTFYYGQENLLDCNLPVEGIHTVYLVMKKDGSGGSSGSGGTEIGSGDGSSGSGSSGSGGTGNGAGEGSSGNKSSGSNSSDSSKTGGNSSSNSKSNNKNNNRSKKAVKRTDGSGSSNNKAGGSSGSAGNKANHTSNANTDVNAGQGNTAKAASADETKTAEETEVEEETEAEKGTDSDGLREEDKDDKGIESGQTADQPDQQKNPETNDNKTASPGLLRLKKASSNIGTKAASDAQTDIKVIYGTALLILIGMAAGLAGFHRQMKQIKEAAESIGEKLS